MIYFKLYWENVHSPSRHRFGSTGFHLHVSDLKKRWKGFDWWRVFPLTEKEKKLNFMQSFSEEIDGEEIVASLTACWSLTAAARVPEPEYSMRKRCGSEWARDFSSLSLSHSIQQPILGLSYTSVYTSPTTEAGSCHFIHLGPDQYFKFNKETQSVMHWDKIGPWASITVKYWVKLYVWMFFYFVIQCDFLLNACSVHLNINIQLWHR